MNANMEQIATTNHQLRKSAQSNFVGLCDWSTLDLETSSRIKSAVTMKVEPTNQNCSECVTICARPILLAAKYSWRLLPGPINARSKTKFMREQHPEKLSPSCGSRFWIGAAHLHPIQIIRASLSVVSRPLHSEPQSEEVPAREGKGMFLERSKSSPQRPQLCSY
jgi:hypothetical protein